jgi:hypothetical protein
MIIEKILKFIFPKIINSMLSMYGCNEYQRGYTDGKKEGYKDGWIECYTYKVTPLLEKHNK